MTLTRDLKQESTAEVKRLYKDIWVTHILPNLEINHLLTFSTTSKEARQVAFAELLKRPTFKAKINHVISRSTAYASARLTYHDDARWGATRLPYALRISQFVLLLLNLFVLEIAYHTYVSGYPSPEQLDAALKKWRSSPSYGSEFDSSPIVSWIARFPNDDYRSLALTLLILTTLSFICRDLFIRTNRPSIQQARNEQEVRTVNKIKSTRLMYLCDQLPRESIVTHSLFARVEGSSRQEKAISLSCNIL